MQEAKKQIQLCGGWHLPGKGTVTSVQVLEQGGREKETIFPEVHLVPESSPPIVEKLSLAKFALLFVRQIHLPLS